MDRIAFNFIHTRTYLKSPADSFAVTHFEAIKSNGGDDDTTKQWKNISEEAEYKRQGLSLMSWKIKSINENYSLSTVYPQEIIIPVKASHNNIPNNVL
jgi:hypothetical protein